jgi:hypothetical protein
MAFRGPKRVYITTAIASYSFVQLASCLALDSGCDGLGGEWEAGGMCSVREWDGLNVSTLEMRQRLMDF